MTLGRQMRARDEHVDTVMLDLRLWPRHPCLSAACSCAPSDLPVPVLPSPLIFCVTQAHPWAVFNNTFHAYSGHAQILQICM